MDIESVKEIVQSLNWGKLKASLEVAPPTRDDLGSLLLIIYHCDRMVRRRSTDDGKRRDKFLNSLTKFLEALGDKEVVQNLDLIRAELRTIDTGYAAIFETESQLPTSTLTGPQRIAATLVKLQTTAQQVRADIDRAVKASPVVTPDLAVFDPYGNRYSPSAVFHTIGAAAFNILMMEAYRGDLFNAQDEIVIPELPQMTEDESHPIEGNFATAHLWKMWKTVEEKARFLNGRLNLIDGKPDWLEQMDQRHRENVETVIEFEADIDQEGYAVMAGERFDERQKQTLLRMMAETNMSNRVAPDLTAEVALAPAALLAFEEGHAAVALHHALSVDLETARVPGIQLTIMELLRGYASLQCISKDYIDGGSVAFPRIERTELLEKLRLWGMSEEAADRFVAAATFTRSSRDLYDCPLIRCADEAFILFGWTIADADLAKVTLSCMGSQKGDVENKGRSFESRMLELFREQNLDARTIRTNRGPKDEEFDYDVVFTWGDYVFFMECKNRSLPGDSPIAVHYFNHSIRSHVKQVTRLRKGLEDYPDILADRYPEAVGKKRVFCVVNALPYARPPIDNIHFSDEGAIRRFFESSSIGINTVPLNPNSDVPPVRMELAKLWKGKSPTPEEFIQYLADPPQLKLAAAHYKRAAQVELLSKTVLVKMVDLQREAPKIEDVAALLMKHTTPAGGH